MATVIETKMLLSGDKVKRLKPYRYEEIQDIAYAIYKTSKDGYPITVYAYNDIILPFTLGKKTFQFQHVICAAMEPDEDPYVTIDGGEEEGPLSELRKQAWFERFEKLFEPDAIWYLSNEEQVIAALRDPDEEEAEWAEAALKIMGVEQGDT